MKKNKISKKARAKIALKKMQERRKPKNHGVGAPLAHAVRIMVKRREESKKASQELMDYDEDDII